MQTRRDFLLTALAAAPLALALPYASGEAFAESAGKQDVYRLYNPASGEHLYTVSTAERDSLIASGWNDEGVGWIAPASSSTPVYRLYNPNADDHHYTTSAAERDTLIEAGWEDQGIGWYSDDAQTVPLYRQYNPNVETAAHNYTPSGGENDDLLNLGWYYEGVGWYGLWSSSTSEATLTETPVSAPRERNARLSGVTWTGDSAYIRTIAEKAAQIGSDTDYFVTYDNELCRVIVFQRAEDGSWEPLKLWNCNGGKNSRTEDGIAMADWGLGKGIHKVVHKRVCNWADEYAGLGYNDWSTDFIEAYQSDSLGHLRYVEGKGYEACLSIHGTSLDRTGWDNTGCCGLLNDQAKWVYDNIPVGTTVYALLWSTLPSRA